MAKPTDETLALPDFDVAIVRKDKHSNDLIESTINLKDWVQQNQKGLILYFYPKDNTPGCTTQAMDFTDKLAEFEQLGYDIMGVSRDSIESHKSFIEKKELNVVLISDEDEKLAQYFDVIKEKNMYGKKVLGMVRSTFVFNKEGLLTHAQRNLRAKEYADRLLETLF